MSFGNQGWTLDLDRLADAVTPATKVIFLNSPANPTGWTATRDELAAILDLARSKDLWIVADEVYGRFVWDGSARAPSFHDVAGPDDRVVYVNTFSKNWAMTGVAPVGSGMVGEGAFMSAPEANGARAVRQPPSGPKHRPNTVISSISLLSNLAT